MQRRRYLNFVKAIACGALLAAGACGDSDDPRDTDGSSASDADGTGNVADGDATHTPVPDIQAIDGPLAPPDLPATA